MTSGRAEGEALQQQFEAIRAAAQTGAVSYGAGSVLMRLAAHDWLDRTGDWRALDRSLSARGDLVPPMLQLARTRPTHEDRLELIAQRRLWAAAVEAQAALEPIVRQPRAARDGRLRVGILSDDLRQTNLGVFAWPLFEHLDRDRFELHVYSKLAGEADGVQALFAGWASAWRSLPGASPRAMAQAIADDGLDVLIELGDPQGWRTCAYRPAPLQLSWLGYPGSSGLKAIDGLILDPFLRPGSPDLLAEPPVMLPHTALAMPMVYFEAEPAIAPDPPEIANGFVTFGTMNGTYKYSAACLDAWAQVLAAVPGSRFLVVRPEAAAPALRDNMARAFAAHGVSADRLMFEPIRGGHLPHYNRIDVALDTFPTPGGMTTCETLWMGVPLVALVGEAIFERVGWSILGGAGMTEFGCTTIGAYVAQAVALARDPARRTAFRRTARERIRSEPIGRPEPFAKAFYDALEQAVRARTSGALS